MRVGEDSVGIQKQRKRSMLDRVNRRDGAMGTRVWTRGSPGSASLGREVSNEKVSAG
jgi:hypothetical protein